MAKRATSTSKKSTVASTDEVAAVSPVRKTVTPRKTAKKAAVPVVASLDAAPAPITHELIAQRAYFISISGTGGSEADNWYRAEAELKGERGV